MTVTTKFPVSLSPRIRDACCYPQDSQICNYTMLCTKCKHFVEPCQLQNVHSTK